MPPRPIRPKEDTTAHDSSDNAAETKSSKRRAVSSACIPCRKRKSKCNGGSPCGTCETVYKTPCSYDADSDHRRKGALKRDIQSLQQRNDALDVIVDSLRALPEAEAIALLRNLRNDANPELLATSLRTNVQLPHGYAPQTLEAEFAQQMGQTVPSNVKTELGSASLETSPLLSRTDSRVAQQEDTQQADQACWFTTFRDAEFVEHLLDLYFCWVHPFYHFFSREHFIRDMRAGKTEFCSAMLLNAVLALGSHYSDRAQARSDAGDEFFGEAKRLLDQGARSSLTTVQALGIMALRQASYGRDSDAYQYAGRCNRMALELGLHLSVVGSGLSTAEGEIRKATFWAVFNLETICSVALGRLSQLPRAAADIEKPALIDRYEAPTWRPYEDANLGHSPSAEQPARHSLFIQCMSNLSELASDMVNTFYAPRERFTSRGLAAAYGQYQDWYRNLPDCFRLENTSLPHVLVLHMYYYTCILHLFRPYIKLELRGANLFPRETCTLCANEISALMAALRAIYGLRRVCLPVTSFLLSASTIHLLNLPAEAPAAHLSQGMHDLQAMSVNHQFAGRCVDIIRALASKWSITLPETAPSTSPFRPIGQVQLPSPPSSAFFNLSIPRRPPGGSGAGSADSMPGQQDSPFAPPPQQQIPAFGVEPTASVDSMQVPGAFWTPFPAQSIPARPTVFPQSSFDFTQLADFQAWPDFSTSAAHDTTMFARHETMPGVGEDGMPGPVGGWGWQT